MANRVVVPITRTFWVGEGDEAYPKTEPNFLQAGLIAMEQGIDIFDRKTCRSSYDYDTNTYVFEQGGE